jgi:hypothetical protein
MKMSGNVLKKKQAYRIFHKNEKAVQTQRRDN